MNMFGNLKQRESSITSAEVEAFASRLEGVAGNLKEVAPLLDSADDSDRGLARDALMILDTFLADEVKAFTKKVAQ